MLLLLLRLPRLTHVGLGAGHTIVSFDSVLKGLGKLKLDEAAIRGDLNNHWEVRRPPPPVPRAALPRAPCARVCLGHGAAWRVATQQHVV